MVKYGKKKMTLGEHCQVHHHHHVYAPLVVNVKGFERIKRKCIGLHLEYVHLLTPEYSLLTKDSVFWKGNDQKYNIFMSMLDRIADDEGIPQTYGGHQNDKWGFGAQGLLSALLNYLRTIDYDGDNI